MNQNGPVMNQTAWAQVSKPPRYATTNVAWRILCITVVTIGRAARAFVQFWNIPVLGEDRERLLREDRERGRTNCKYYV
jgi:hypothetical protein